MIILVTGSAGFVGSSLVYELLKKNFQVVGIDNHNKFCNPYLQNGRLSRFISNSKYTHIQIDISKKDLLEEVFKKFNPKVVINLAAQAGVRYSIENPSIYIQSNIVGFANILEFSKLYKVEHLIYASSSSVYGASRSLPYSINDSVDHPLSMYAASKKSNELMAYSYSHLHNLPTTGLRFFTVYGPWGRPDMALFKFTNSIFSNKDIEIFNNGNHSRDFTYIDDIVGGIVQLIDMPPSSKKTHKPSKSINSSLNPPWSIYNMGNNKPTKLMDFITLLENIIGKKGRKVFLDAQAGDMDATYADITESKEFFNFSPKTSLEEGIFNFVKWYKDFYKIKG